MNGRRAMGAFAIALAIGVVVGSWATAKTGDSVIGKVNSVAMHVSNEGESIGRQVSFLNGFVPVAKRVLPAVQSATPITIH